MWAVAAASAPADRLPTKRGSTAMLPSASLHSAPNVDHPFIEIHVIPGQAQRLTLAQTECERHGPASRVRRSPRCLKERTTFVAGQGIDLDGGHARRTGDGGWVLAQVVAPHRLAQR